MKALAVILIALTVAVLAGHYVAEDPGFIVIGYGGKVIRTTFAFFALVLVLGIVVLIATLNFLRNLRELRERYQQWVIERRRQRAHSSLTDGLLAMAAGDFAQAERQFTRGLDDDSQPEVHYLAAAEAAQALKAPGRRDNYLSLAQELNPAIRTPLDIKRAEWLLGNGQLTEARPLIERLKAAEVGNPQVLKLQMDLYQQSHDHEALLALIPDIRRDHVLSHDDAIALERRSAVAILAGERTDVEALTRRWRGFSKHLRASPEVLGAYVRGLCRFGADDEAEKLTRKQLEKAWDSSLAALYGEIECDPPARQLRKLEAWSMTRGDDPGLRLARARQSIRAGHWAQALSQLEDLMRAQPSPLLHQLLAAIAEGLDDPGAALAHRRAGLELATGERIGALLPSPDASAAQQTP